MVFLRNEAFEAVPLVPPHEPNKLGSLKSPPAPQRRGRARGPPNIPGGPQGCGAAPRQPCPASPAERIVESLTAAILDLVGLYCSTFNADFQTATPGSREHGVVQEACLLSCPLSFTVYATHRIPITWAAR